MLRSGTALRRFALLAAALVVALAMALVSALWLAVPCAGSGTRMPAILLPPLLLACGAAMALRAMAASYPHDRLGLCNAVTLARAALVAGLVAVLLSPGGLAAPDLRWGLVGVALFALALDGLDGWLARREGLVSAFGARFDMEVDAALGLVLALLALKAGSAGPWVLVLGGLRYVYVAARWVWPWLRGNLPPRRGRKTICVIQIATLIALLAPPVVPPLSLWLGGAATALLAGSFAVDVHWLWRRR